MPGERLQFGIPYPGMMEVEVKRPAAEVWKRVGKCCDIG